MTIPNTQRFDTLRADLHADYGHEYTAAEIDSFLDATIARHTEGATLEEFIPVMVEREVREHFGTHRIHVRFSAGTDHALAQAAVALTKKYAGDALLVDAAVAHPENGTDSHMAHVLEERGLAEADRYVEDLRMVTMPDYIVYLGRDIERDEAGKDIKIWDIAKADTVEATRELADDLGARVLYMLNRLGIEPVGEHAAAEA
ncbi:three-helix bundle dimerization domain-containing protein [Corynebacterium sp.]|uniref:three-helix bundle dimerization domain-containing protein n=1 Tax=Corynebacterium sp. TaxID=1720 RepID=UPI0026DD9791|nr:protein tyrosine phosphatase [Corynebacterium sp.]MDO5033133.1 protein tyrosine phosphatase [Corynebacterium sp.]